MWATPEWQAFLGDPPPDVHEVLAAIPKECFERSLFRSSLSLLVSLSLTLLAGGLAHQQLRRTSEHANAERIQNQRRIVHPGPRGNILDRHQRIDQIDRKSVV